MLNDNKIKIAPTDQLENYVYSHICIEFMDLAICTLAMAKFKVYYNITGGKWNQVLARY